MAVAMKSPPKVDAKMMVRGDIFVQSSYCLGPMRKTELASLEIVGLCATASFLEIAGGFCA